MSAEEWRDIPGFEGEYQVSDLGRVRSIDRIVEQDSRWGVIRRRLQGKVLSPHLEKSGYLGVQLGRRKKQRVHELVAAAFIGPRSPGATLAITTASLVIIGQGTCSMERLPKTTKIAFGMGAVAREKLTRWQSSPKKTWRRSGRSAASSRQGTWLHSWVWSQDQL